MEHQIVLDAKELSTISIECLKCHSQLVLDIESGAFLDPSRCPSKCPSPGCDTRYFAEYSANEQYSAMNKNPIFEYIRDLRDLRRSGPKITFRLKATPQPAADTTERQ
jgi:hypothetical protein